MGESTTIAYRAKTATCDDSRSHLVRVKMKKPTRASPNIGVGVCLLVRFSERKENEIQNYPDGSSIDVILLLT